MVLSVKRPKVVIFDITGTASKSGFLEKILFPFFKDNVEKYVEKNWQKKDFLILYEKIFAQSAEFNRQEPATPLVLPHDNEQGRATFLTFVHFIHDNGVDSPPVTKLRFKVWFDGYQQEKLRTPIYSDVPKRIRKWHSEGVKFYCFSNTWVEAQKFLLKQTTHGDLTSLISGHYDNEFGNLNDAQSWKKLAQEIHEQLQDMLLLTKSAPEGHAAADAGCRVVLVLTHRHNVKALTVEDKQRFNYVRTLNDLVWEDEASVPLPTPQSKV